MLSRYFLRQFVRSPARYAVFNESCARLTMPVRALSANGLISTRLHPHSKPYFLQGTVVNKFSSSHVSTSRDAAKGEDEDISKLSGVKRLKMLWKNYGMLSLVTYFSLYGCTLTGMFFALKADLLSASSFGLDAVSVISSFCDTIENWTGHDELPKFLRQNPVYGTAVLAYIMTKFTEPFRIGITAVAVPKIAKYISLR